jgi:hypothetical protein
LGNALEDAAGDALKIKSNFARESGEMVIQADLINPCNSASTIHTRAHKKQACIFQRSESFATTHLLGTHHMFGAVLNERLPGADVSSNLLAFSGDLSHVLVHCFLT